MERKTVFTPQAKWCHASVTVKEKTLKLLRYEICCRCWYHTQECLLQAQHKAAALESPFFIIIITFIAYIMAAIAQQGISMLMLKECRWL